MGQSYTYTLQATASDSATVSYLLVSGPVGATLDPSSGVLSYTPALTDPGTDAFEVRAYDSRGSFADQRWALTVSGVVGGPLLPPVVDQIINEGQTLSLPIAATDPNNLPLIYWADHLPGGAPPSTRRHRR